MFSEILFKEVAESGGAKVSEVYEIYILFLLPLKYFIVLSSAVDKSFYIYLNNLTI